MAPNVTSGSRNSYGYMQPPGYGMGALNSSGQYYGFGGGGGYGSPISPMPSLGYSPPPWPGLGMVDPLQSLPRTAGMQGDTGIPGGIGGMLGMLGDRFTGASLWGNSEARGASKSELENWLFPAMQMAMNQRSQTYEQELGRYNAYEQALINRANMANSRWQQQREDQAMRFGQQRWSSEFGEAGRQFDTQTELAREAGSREMTMAQMQDALSRWTTGEQLGFNREELATQNALARWQTGQQLGFSREELASQDALARWQQTQQLGFGREQLMSQEQQAAAQRQLQRQMQQAGFGQERWQTQQQLGFGREQLAQQARESDLRYGARGIENRSLDIQSRESQANRQLQERMQGRQLETQRWQTERNMDLAREQMQSQEQAARWQQHGRAQRPNTTWARNW